MTVNALHNMVQDNYDRDELSSFFELTLYHTISWWIDVANDIPLDELDVLEQVKEEIDKEKPKKSRLQNCLKLIAPMITIANGIPVLSTNLQKLHDIIIQCIMNL